MSDFENNTGSRSATTGTGPLTLTTALKYHRGIPDVLGEGDSRTFFAIDASGTDYMLFEGTYTASGTSLSVDTVINSSNSDNAVNWSGGNIEIRLVADADSLKDMSNMVEGTNAKILTPAERTKLGYITVTAAENINDMADDIAALQDVDIGDMTAASALTGAEFVPVEQGGNGRKATVDQFDRTMSEIIFTRAKSSVQGACAFFGAPIGFTSSDGDDFGKDPYTVNQSGTGAGATVTNFLGQVVTLTTGSSSTGRVSLKSSMAVSFWAGNRSFDQSWMCGTSDTDPVSNGHHYYVGFLSTVTAVNPQGMFFELTPSSNNWHAVVRNAGGVTKTDTGVAGSTTNKTFRIVYDHDDAETRFYIDGALEATILDSTRVMANFTLMEMAIAAHDLTSSSEKKFYPVGAHSFKHAMGVTYDV
ncbi:MAG: hypothetical protein CME59_02210 [Halioglobus sp.]|nr:hypothetical protein [Halioglobus sp.]|tara:strand:- start:4621 stop:5874 length:1254 start_codon:yes stop_codon:yes gene_type:complete